jgi:hypothetical protein
VVRTARRYALVAALAATLASVGVAGASSPAKTTVTIYRAFTGTGLIVPHVRVAAGYCWTESLTSARYDAFRCFVGNYIYDPCFSSPVPTDDVVVCPTDPANDTALAIHLTKPLPATFSHSPPSPALAPWAVETAAGQVCEFASGASGIAGKLRENYFCGNDGKGNALWGSPDRNTEPWTMIETPADATKLNRSHRVGLQRVWI